MAFVRILNTLTRDKQIGKHIVPIVPDEARTFGMEGMFRQIGIYASQGQLYEPEDAGELMYYREDKKGQIIEEGINEAGAFCSWAAAGTSYSNHDIPMVPFYIYYSMFGFQRIGDFIWAGENYAHPQMPAGVEDGILKGMYLLKVGGQGKIRAQLMGSGTILREVLAAAELLEQDFDVPSDVWSVTSFNELRREGLEVERWNQLHPGEEPRKCYIETCLSDRPGPYIAATDYMKIVPDQIQRWVPGSFVSLGTDGYGRSDARKALREHFEVDRRYIAVTALKALADDGVLDQETVTGAIEKYGIDPDRPDPVTL